MTEVNGSTGSNTNEVKEDKDMNANEILAQMAALQRQLQQAMEENAELRKKGNERKLTFKVSLQKGITVLGLRRYGVTCYKQEWLRILAQAEDLKKFIETHDQELSQGFFKEGPTPPPEDTADHNGHN